MAAMKKLIVPTLCLLLGCAGGAAVGSVTAQTWPEPTGAQRWQQECVQIHSASARNYRPEVAGLLRARGDAGWELVLVNTAGDFCFKRPAP